MNNESRSQGLRRLEGLTRATAAREESLSEERQRFARLKEQGAPRVVVADQLFQTPVVVAARMIAHVTRHNQFFGRTAGRILEPSAGLGRLVSAASIAFPESDLFCVDIEPACIETLAAGEWPRTQILQHDFLNLSPAQIGTFDTVLMNPPFRRGSDIRHIEHARQFLRPRGLLVGLCYAGTRQTLELLPNVSFFERLPAHSFRESGTDAPVHLIGIEA